MRLFEIASWNRISMYGASLIIASSVAYSCNSPGIHESTTHSPNAVNAAPKVTTSSRAHSTNSSSVLTPPSPGFTIHKAVDVPNGMVSAQIQIGNPPFFVTVPDETPSDEIVSQTQRSMRCLRPFETLTNTPLGTILVWDIGEQYPDGSYFVWAYPTSTLGSNLLGPGNTFCYSYQAQAYSGSPLYGANNPRYTGGQSSSTTGATTAGSSSGPHPNNLSG